MYDLNKKFESDRETSIEAAKIAINMGLSSGEISNITSLTIEEIEIIKEALKENPYVF